MADKKTAVIVIITFVVIITVMILLVFIQRKNEFYEKWGDLAIAAESDERARYIIENGELYPEELLDLYDGSDYRLDFVYGYPFHKDDYANMEYTTEELSGETVPALYMSDTRWAYQKCDIGYICTDGCAAVCLTMAYIYLTGKSDFDPYKIALIAAKNNGVGFWGGISDDAVEGICDEIALQVKMYDYSTDMQKSAQVDMATVKEIIDSGHVLMAGMSGETFGTHAIIIRGYDSESVYINDPADPEKTAAKWDFEKLEKEIVFIYDLSAGEDDHEN